MEVVEKETESKVVTPSVIVHVIVSGSIEPAFAITKTSPDVTAAGKTSSPAPVESSTQMIVTASSEFAD